ncbi:hypothetical protein KC318_g4671 [Hortaea werneckii]|uniref:Uncharacterized protein n=1 Tax=Hortaea werneckii TaxID=91943 RepID=A0A3M7A2W5_HORWE|nr:hypothetical protein KC334_g8161 [Hortaea werneckii]KAI7014737.1 hypothetical protein KC355_g4580 [Hortaea werneckii]KAI7669430.1 hypothetical protein KC318_g4671 [Hortaea werneckii]RMY21865.1 hypothetical protein D0867_03078 [Hortaea werneckii]RMY37810.1 hypothetical protein D0866_03029 [Hortaea werneckii]
MTTSTSRTVALPTSLIVQTGQPPRTSTRSILSTPTRPPISTNSPSSSSPTQQPSTYHGLPNVLPPTTNDWLLRLGDLALYNPELLAIAVALFQHTFVFGLLFLLRAFSPKRALDLHYLTLIFALSFVALPLVFLFDRRIDEIKLLFFLEHEAVEYLIAIRVLAPPGFVAKWSGAIVLAAWCALVAITIPVVLDSRFRHAADIVAWCAFVSDFLLGLSGIALVRRWAVSRSRITGFALRKLRAEAMARLAFMCHGFVTMPVGPIFTLVLYRNLNPEYFAWTFVAVFLSAFFSIALMVPVIALFLSNIRWCCGSRKKVFPGQAEWYEELEQQDHLEQAEKQGRSAERYDPPPHQRMLAPHPEQRYEDFAIEDPAPRYYPSQPPASNNPHETRLPSEAWRVRLPEEHRSTAWTSIRPPHRRLPN